MEDVDRPRVVAGSADRILATLEAFGFEWHGEVLWQSDREPAYNAALEALRSRGLTFACSCSRLDIAPEPRYPGYCRDGPRNPDADLAIRLRVDSGHLQFTDGIQGAFRQDVSLAAGDLILKRRDGWFAYLLAVVVDDAYQGITKIVRGADLLDHTAAQIYLQKQLGVPSPDYAHVPALVEPDGSKLSKSARSVPLEPQAALRQLLYVFELLGLVPHPRSPAPRSPAPGIGPTSTGTCAGSPGDPHSRWRPASARGYAGTLLQRRRKRSLALTLHCAILRLHSIQ